MEVAILITLRETLEASLVVGIILAYLNKTENSNHKIWVWKGVGAGIILSLVLAYFFQTYLEGFTGKAEELYEGVAMWIAAGLLTWMILWMLKQRHNLKKNIEDQLHVHIKKDYPIGLFFLAFASVTREGIETVIFLQAALLQNESRYSLIGAALGILLAIVLAYSFFRGVVKIALRKFFTITSVLLILFAAGLFAHGLHEFQEVGLVPTLIEHVWDFNALLNENGAIGGILKGLFGYNGNPSLLEVLSYLAYLMGIGLTWRSIEKKHKQI